MCVNGASWVRENILKKYPDEEITVYAVWFNMIPGDRKERWNPKQLDDARVTHYWDQDRVVGKWISANVKDCEHLGPVDWDSYYLFDSDGEWDDTLQGIKACGTPIYRKTQRLALAADALFDSRSEDK